jgi:hypothetical protein
MSYFEMVTNTRKVIKKLRSKKKLTSEEREIMAVHVEVLLTTYSNIID